jgi:thiol:disulfide interchange protein DsbD
MGTALGFALTQPWLVSLAIFQALGLGMALPYLLLSFSPALRRFLPRPGPWLERFKEMLAFPLYATAAWLVWVLSLQTGSAGVAVALAGIILLAFAAWLVRATAAAGPHWYWAARLGAVAAMVLALALVRLPAATGPAVSQAPGLTQQGVAWEPFSKERLAELQAENRPVLVNFTAAWCITCLVNERVALNSPRVAGSLAGKGVAYLKADWTSRDPVITQMLASFGRSGVPLYVLYPSQKAQSVILPQLLTETLLLQAIQEL